MYKFLEFIKSIIKALKSKLSIKYEKTPKELDIMFDNYKPIYKSRRFFNFLHSPKQQVGSIAFYQFIFIFGNFYIVFSDITVILVSYPLIGVLLLFVFVREKIREAAVSSISKKFNIKRIVFTDRTFLLFVGIGILFMGIFILNFGDEINIKPRHGISVTLTGIIIILNDFYINHMEKKIERENLTKTFSIPTVLYTLETNTRQYFFKPNVKVLNFYRQFVHILLLFTMILSIRELWGFSPITDTLTWFPDAMSFRTLTALNMFLLIIYKNIIRNFANPVFDATKYTNMPVGGEKLAKTLKTAYTSTALASLVGGSIAGGIYFLDNVFDSATHEHCEKVPRPIRHFCQYTKGLPVYLENAEDYEVYLRSRKMQGGETCIFANEDHSIDAHKTNIKLNDLSAFLDKHGPKNDFPIRSLSSDYTGPPINMKDPEFLDFMEKDKKIVTPHNFWNPLRFLKKT